MDNLELIPYQPVDEPVAIPDEAVLTSIEETVYFYDDEFAGEDETEKVARIITGYIKNKQIGLIKTQTSLDASRIARIAFVIARNHDLMNEDDKFSTVLSVYKAITVDGNNDVEGQLAIICGSAVTQLIKQDAKLQETSRQGAHEPQRRTITDYGGKIRRKPKTITR